MSGFAHVCKVMRLWLGSKPSLPTLGWCAVAVPAALGLYGQTTAPDSQTQATRRLSAPTNTLEFDVASIRQNKSGATPYSNFPINSGTMYSATQGIFSSINRPLVDYIVFAYKITDSQLQDLKSQLPTWALSDGFDIQARSENHDPSKDEMRLMVQSLLADRFKLRIHTETRQVSIFALVLAKRGIIGPQLKSNMVANSCSTADSAVPVPDATSAPVTKLVGVWPTSCGGVNRADVALSPGVIRVGGRNVSMEYIANSITGLGALNRPVMDETRLPGNFDFVLEFAPEITAGADPGNPQPDSGGPSFLEALEKQLGLKLIPQKAAAAFIRVEHVEPPTAN